MEIITSRKNPLLQKIRQLSSGGRSVREKAGEYLGDGVKLLEEALKWDAPLTTVVVSPEVTPPALPAGVRLVQVPRDVMETISPMKTPQGACFWPSCPLPLRRSGWREDAIWCWTGCRTGQCGHYLALRRRLGADGLLLVNAAPTVQRQGGAGHHGACFRLPVWETTVEGLEKLLKASQILYMPRP